MAKKKHNGAWSKRAFQKFPAHIQSVYKANSGPFFVGAAKWVTEKEIRQGQYSHLGLSVSASGDLVIANANVTPASSTGTRAKWNHYGQTVTRNDKPKIQRSFTVYNPRAFGYLPITYTRTGMFYQKEKRFGRKLSIQLSSLGGTTVGDERVYIIGAVLSGSVKSKNAAGRADLLFRASLLQEQFGAVNMFGHKPSSDDLKKLVFVNWDLLPPGLRNIQVAHAISQSGGNSKIIQKHLVERIDWIRKKCPGVDIRSGVSQFSGYFLAIVSDTCVIAEHVVPGNAIYVFYKDWETLTKRSKEWLIKNGGSRVERIIHDDGKQWQSRLAEIIKKHKP